MPQPAPVFTRLSALDLSNLRLESPDCPFHFAGLVTVEAAPLLDGSGELRLAEIRQRLERRLPRTPVLRRRLLVPGLLRGRPVWVDDERFEIRNHVLAAAVPAPGGDAQLLATAAELYSALLDRSRPLWELWFLTGLDQDRLGVMLKLHHAVADGLAAVALMSALFDLAPDAPEPAPQTWVPAPAPASWPLLRDNLSEKGRAVRALAHPAALARGAKAFVAEARRQQRQPKAPRTSLNRPGRAGRRIRFLRLDLDEVKKLAHAHQAKVNDVVLTIWAAGLGHLLASRQEIVEPAQLITSVALSYRADGESGELGNRVGVLSVPLPLDGEPGERLARIAAATRRAKSEQHPAGVAAAMSALAATPLVRRYIDHQRAVNVFSTNVAGPPVPVYVLGARILDILPIVQVAGNVGLSLCAFSYAGRLFLVITADAEGNPDVDVLVEGMRGAIASMEIGDPATRNLLSAGRLS